MYSTILRRIVKVLLDSSTPNITVCKKQLIKFYAVPFDTCSQMTIHCGLKHAGILYVII